MLYKCYNKNMDYRTSIKDLRTNMFLTQSEFAKLLNVSFSTINRWENGHCEPTMKAKRKLNKLFQKNSKESNK